MRYHRNQRCKSGCVKWDRFLLLWLLGIRLPIPLIIALLGGFSSHCSAAFTD
jgi:hypothetical protein